jgi:hypothetical protein
MQRPPRRNRQPAYCFRLIPTLPKIGNCYDLAHVEAAAVYDALTPDFGSPPRLLAWCPAADKECELLTKVKGRATTRTHNLLMPSPPSRRRHGIGIPHADSWKFSYLRVPKRQNVTGYDARMLRLLTLRRRFTMR